MVIIFVVCWIHHFFETRKCSCVMHQLAVVVVVVVWSERTNHHCQLDEQITLCDKAASTNLNLEALFGREETDIDWADSFRQPCWQCVMIYSAHICHCIHIMFCSVGSQDSGTEMCGLRFRGNKTITILTILLMDSVLFLWIGSLVMWFHIAILNIRCIYIYVW